MTDKKISELTSITGADVSDANDVLPIVDTSVATTKKITRAELFKSVSSVDINGGTIDGTVIGGSTPAAISGTTGTFSGDVSIADKIVHTGDTNTALRFPAADTVTVETAGSERMRITSSGNVGIGTSSPTANVHVSGSGVTQLYLSDTGGATDQKTWGFQYGTSIGAGTFRLRALNDANTSGQNAYIITRSGIGVQTHQWLTAGSERMRIDSSGNVGIGASIPTVKVDVSGAGNLASRARFTRSDQSATLQLGGYRDTSNCPYIGSETNHAFAFITNDTERMRITSSGNVGIGTSSPTNLLDVNADSIRVRTAQTPASASAAGNQGEIAWDADYIYVCVATDTWKRVAIATW